jgi:hypothetical protein
MPNASDPGGDPLRHVSYSVRPGIRPDPDRPWWERLRAFLAFIFLGR